MEDGATFARFEILTHPANGFRGGAIVMHTHEFQERLMVANPSFAPCRKGPA